MEADSTTIDIDNSKMVKDEVSLPFSTSPGNLQLYKCLIIDSEKKNLESQVVERLQRFGLLPTTVKCPSANPECRVKCKSARVIDRVQWLCEGCGKRQPIRTGSFFFKLQCSLLQALQMVFAWCEDADLTVATEFFGVKPRVASVIYDKLDDLAVKELRMHKLGGANSVVLTEMYPDCLNRLSPDTTDQPNTHRILMIADTKHIPTFYRLHVINDGKKTSNNMVEEEHLKCEVEQVLLCVTEPESMIVMGNNMPTVQGATSVQKLVQYCDLDMQHFLTSRIWSQAISLCAASRDICAGAPAVQRYLNTSLYRLRYGDGFYEHILRIVANEFTEQYEE